MNDGLGGLPGADHSGYQRVLPGRGRQLGTTYDTCADVNPSPSAELLLCVDGCRTCVRQPCT